MKLFKPVLSAGIIALGMMTGAAQAAFLTVHAEDAYVGGGSESSGRGQGFQALEDITVNSIGIHGNLRSLSHTVDIFSSDNGKTAGDLLASFTKTLGGDGFAWYDLALEFTFSADSFYVVNWRPTDDVDWVEQSGNVGNAGINYFKDGSLPETDGPIRLIEGFAGASPDPGNSLHPAMRYGVGAQVPLPASLPLLIGALGALGYAGRRRKT